MHVRHQLFYTPSNKVLQAQKQGQEPQSAMDWRSPRLLREASFQNKSLLVPTDGPKAGEESVAVRGADMWALGLQKYRRGRGKEGSPERFLRTQQGPIRPRFTLPLGLPGATMATV